MVVIVCPSCGFAKVYPAGETPETCPSCGSTEIRMAAFRGWEATNDAPALRKFRRPSFKKRKLTVPIVKVGEGGFLLNLPLLFGESPAPIAEGEAGEFELIA